MNENLTTTLASQQKSLVREPSWILPEWLHPNIYTFYNKNYTYRKQEIQKDVSHESTGRYPDGSIFAKLSSDGLMHLDEESDLWLKRQNSLLAHLSDQEFTQILPLINGVRWDNLLTGFEKYLRIESIILAFSQQDILKKKIKNQK